MAISNLLASNGFNITADSIATTSVENFNVDNNIEGSLKVAGGANVVLGLRAQWLNCARDNDPPPDTRQKGDMYFNTLTTKLMVYTGLAWIALN